MAIRTQRSSAVEAHEDRVLLHTDWAGYLKILDAIGEARGIRVTYRPRGARDHRHQRRARRIWLTSLVCC